MASSSCASGAVSQRAEMYSQGGFVWAFVRTERREMVGQVVTPRESGLITVEFECELYKFRKHYERKALRPVTEFECELYKFRKHGERTALRPLTVCELQHQILKSLMPKSSLDYENMRKVRINYTVRQYCAAMTCSSEPWALFITGYKCSGKSAIFETLKQRSLGQTKFVHVNGDDIRLVMFGGDENDAALLACERFYRETEDIAINDRNFVSDASAARRQITEATLDMKANYVADSLTIPPDVPIAFKHAGYRVTVLFIEIGLHSDELADKQRVTEARAKAANKVRSRKVVINPNGIQNTNKGMNETAEKLLPHQMPVYYIASVDDDFIDMGPLLRMDGAEERSSFLADARRMQRTG